MEYVDFTLRIRLGRPYWETTGTEPVNQPPVTGADFATTEPDTPVLIDVIVNDSDPEGGALDLVSASATAGTAMIQPDDTILYTPPPGFTGTDTVTYTVTDPQGASGQGSLTVTVAAANQPPVTVSDSAAVFADTPTILDVLANDSDPEGGALTLLGASAVSGTVTVRPDNTVLYTPPPGFTGADTVSYTVGDASGAQTQGTAVISVAAPSLDITQNADGTLTVNASTGAVAITVTSPSEFAGTYGTDTGLLAAGPVNLAAPAANGVAEVGQTLTVRPGLWIASGATSAAYRWLRDGNQIAGATALDYLVGAGDAGRMLSAEETLTDAAGSRTAASTPRSVAAFYAPQSDPLLRAWYDASDAASITASGGSVTAWANKAGTANLTPSSGTSEPSTGTRTIGGRNVLDFSGSDRMRGTVTLPANGNVALHMVLAIDSVVSSFAAIASMDAVNDFQIDAASDTQFNGRMNLTGIGSTFSLTGGPFTGPKIVSVIFDRTGTGVAQVWVNGVLAGSGAYSLALDTGQLLVIMSNRSQNAYVDGAVGEVLLTGDVSNRAAVHGYLAQKWGIV